MTELKIDNFRLVAALGYASRGWQVFPITYPKIGATGKVFCSCGDLRCGNVGKHPRNGSNGLKDGTADKVQIAKWWQAWPASNIGIVTGLASGFFVVDIDPRHGGNETLAKLMDEHGDLPETVEANTGGGGKHFLFLMPPFKLKSDNRGKLLGPGIDVKTDGGYIVAPPSLHVSTNRYVWAEGAAPEQQGISQAPAWMLDMLRDDPPPEKIEIKKPINRISNIDENRFRNPDYWLDRALNESGAGRNDRGFWLACQLRDARLTESEARGIMQDYCRRVPSGDHSYSEKEAMASLRQAYSHSPREAIEPKQKQDKPSKTTVEVFQQNAKSEQGDTPSSELESHFEGVISGRIYAVPWPWDLLTSSTQALLPGSITVICGDPGVGKTFMILQCLQFWHGAGYEPKVFFIEKDRKFHTRRLLAQLEANGSMVDFDWVKKNAPLIRDAIKTHRQSIDELGACIDSAPCERVTLDSLLQWLQLNCEAKKRVLVIDPITAAHAGVDRWTKDDDFVLAAQSLLNKHGASLILITHAKKGNRPGMPTGHDMGGGAAYYRFSDTTIWVKKLKQPRKVKYQTRMGPASGKMTLFFDLHKTREGRGQGLELACTFGLDLKFVEHGIVLKELPEDEAA